MADLSGWWVLKGEDLWDMLQRVAMGQAPLDVFEEEYENCEHTNVVGEEAGEPENRCGVRVGTELLQCVRTDGLRRFTLEGHSLYYICPDHVSYAVKFGFDEVT